MKPDIQTKEAVPFLKSVNNSGPTREKPRFLTRMGRLGRLSPIATNALVFFLTSTLWAVIILFSRPQLQSSPVWPYDLGHGNSIFDGTNFAGCGHSLEEAERRGCEYDILANGHFPKGCIDELGIDEYKRESTTWYGFADPNWTVRIPSAEEMGRHGVYYTNLRDHIVHCALLWKRQYRAFAENWRFIDSVIASEEHTFHCADFLAELTDYTEHPDWRTIPIPVEVGYAACFDMQDRLRQQDTG
ncbi:hypothetical protein B0T14DRAFT_524045 [Immersiella caudata]|uniref:Uncharacterized protein n=1 Tax=Immersiella caudata TaxID=314043 RepID=A0AA39WKA0_9PEZI|nr:hypothetical protein B0T14DRAFT_524045 [Immersiella caudata]